MGGLDGMSRVGGISRLHRLGQTKQPGDFLDTGLVLVGDLALPGS